MIYKYFNCATRENKERLTHILSKREIWFADWRKFNDPSEGEFIIKKRKIDKKFDPYINWDVADSLISESKDAFSVLCCSESSNNSLLWSLYADSHRGVCVGFDVIRKNGIRYEMVNVKYQQKKPAVYMNEIDDDRALKILSVKGPDYSAEKEIRYIRKYPSGFNKIKIQEIIVGLKANETTIKIVKESAKKKHPIFRCKKSELNIYKLDRDLLL